jgi:hypothetical protein
MPKMKPGKDQGNAALPKLGSPWTSKHSQDLLKYNAVDDHAAHPMSMRGPLDKHHPMKKYGDPMKKYGPLSLHGPGGTHPDPKKKATTTLSNALASDKDYKEVPGYEERLGGELDEVVVTAPVETNKQKRQAEREARRKERRNTYSQAGMAIQTLGTFLPGGGGKYKRRQLEKTARKGLL